jgi:hypothetical protein
LDDGTQEEDFDFAAGGELVAEEPGGKDFAFVGYEEVGGMEVVAEVVEVAVLQLACVAMDDKQAGAITWLGGGLRDQFGGEVVVEFVDSHWRSFR